MTGAPEPAVDPDAAAPTPTAAATSSTATLSARAGQDDRENRGDRDDGDEDVPGRATDSGSPPADVGSPGLLATGLSSGASVARWRCSSICLVFGLDPGRGRRAG